MDNGKSDERDSAVKDDLMLAITWRFRNATKHEKLTQRNDLDQTRSQDLVPFLLYK